MFSDEGRSLDEDTLEYAWLVEVQLGKLSGKLTAPQVSCFFHPLLFLNENNWHRKKLISSVLILLLLFFFEFAAASSYNRIRNICDVNL